MTYTQKEHEEMHIKLNGLTSEQVKYTNSFEVREKNHDPGQRAQMQYANTLVDVSKVKELDTEEAIALRQEHKARYEEIKGNAQIIIPSEKATERSDFKGEDSGRSASKRDTRAHMYGSRLRKKRLMAEEIEKLEDKQTEEREKLGVDPAYDPRVLLARELGIEREFDDNYLSRTITHFLSLDLRINIATDEDFMKEYSYLSNLKGELEVMKTVALYSRYSHGLREDLDKSLKRQGIYEQYQYKYKKIELLVKYFDAKKAVLTDGYYRTHYDEEITTKKTDKMWFEMTDEEKAVNDLAEKLDKLKAATDALSSDSGEKINLPEYKEEKFEPLSYIDNYTHDDQRLSKEFWMRMDEYKKYYSANSDPEVESEAIKKLESLKDGTIKLSPYEQTVLSDLEAHFKRQYEYGNADEKEYFEKLDIHKNPSSSMLAEWKSVKNQVLFPHQPKAADVQQRLVNDCYLLSTLSSVAAKDPAVIKDCMTDMGDSVVVRLFLPQKKAEAIRDDRMFVGGMGEVYVRVSKEVPRVAGTVDMYAHGPLWVQMFEKAYAIVMGGKAGYDGIALGNAYEALNVIYGPGYAEMHKLLNFEGNDIDIDEEATNATGEIRSKRAGAAPVEIQELDMDEVLEGFEAEDVEAFDEPVNVETPATKEKKEIEPGHIAGLVVRKAIAAAVRETGDMLPSIESVVNQYLSQNPEHATGSEEDETLVKILVDGLEYQYGLSHEPFSGEYTDTAEAVFADYKELVSSGQTIIVGCNPSMNEPYPGFAEEYSKGLKSTGIRPGHAYAIMRLTEEEGFKYVELRDSYARFRRDYELTKDENGKVTSYKMVNDSHILQLTTGENSGLFRMELNDFLKTFNVVSGIKAGNTKHGGHRYLS